MAKIKIEDIKEEAKLNNWKVLSNEYINLDTEMVFECAEGHKVYFPYKKIRNKWECPVCKINKFKVEKNQYIPKKNGIKRVLGLDQATHISGFSIFDNEELVSHGTLKVYEDDEIERDNHIKQWLISTIENQKIDIVGIEDIQLQSFNNKNVGVKTFKILARLQGILMECCYEMGIDYVLCPPASWRSHCKVRGRAKADQKKSMQLIVKELFDISVSNDEADAIGIGKYVAETKQKKKKIVNWEDD